MFRSKFLWAFVLGVVTSVLIFEAKINLGYSPVWSRALEVLALPGTHFVGMLNTPGSLIGGWTRFLAALGFACNFLVYLFFWYACIWMTSYLRTRQHPYDRGHTLVPPSL
jgi:hypothetical protein